MRKQSQYHLCNKELENRRESEQRFPNVVDISNMLSIFNNQKKRKREKEKL